MTKQLYMIIATGATPDLTKFVAVAGVREAPLSAKLFGHNHPGMQCIAPPISGKGFSPLTLEQLQYLFWNQTQQPPTGDYAEMVKSLRVIAERIPADQTPLEHLERTVERTLPAEGSQSSTGEPKAVKQPGEAPKKGSTTGLVWELADEVLGQHPLGTDWKIIRASVMAICEKEGINPATAATQYAKWKGSKLKPAAA
mgnify:CR=1 FL=1